MTSENVNFSQCINPKGYEMSSETDTKPIYNQWADRVQIATKLMAKNTGHRVAATPHILIGVLKTGPAANLLKRQFGVTSERVVLIVRDMPKPTPKGLGEDFLYTDGAREVFAKAELLSKEFSFKHEMVYTDHLLAALLQVNDEHFAHVLGILGVDHDELLAEAMQMLESKSKLGQS